MLGGTAAWPLAARAQQPTMPVVVFLDSRTLEAVADRLGGFRRGLGEAGFVEGENVTVEYRWAENENERLPKLAADLARRGRCCHRRGGATCLIRRESRGCHGPYGVPSG